MLQQMNRRARLLAGINTATRSSHCSPDERTALELLHTTSPPAQPVIDSDATKRVMLDDWAYDNILSYLQALDPTIISHKHADDTTLRLNTHNVIQQSATSLRHFEYKGRTYSTSTEHFGNSSFVFATLSGQQWIGFVTRVWVMDIRGISRTFLTVVPYEDLSAEDQRHNPWRSRPGFRSQLVYSQSRHTPIIVEPNSIVAHAPCLMRPEGTYPGIARGILVVHCNLNLGRR